MAPGSSRLTERTWGPVKVKWSPKLTRLPHCADAPGIGYFVEMKFNMSCFYCCSSESYQSCLTVCLCYSKCQPGMVALIWIPVLRRLRYDYMPTWPTVRTPQKKKKRGGGWVGSCVLCSGMTVNCLNWAQPQDLKAKIIMQMSAWHTVGPIGTKLVIKCISNDSSWTPHTSGRDILFLSSNIKINKLH